MTEALQPLHIGTQRTFLTVQFIFSLTWKVLLFNFKRDPSIIFFTKTAYWFIVIADTRGSSVFMKFRIYQKYILDLEVGIAFYNIYIVLMHMCNNIGIKHGFLCINICWAPREMLKPEPERALRL